MNYRKSNSTLGRRFVGIGAVVSLAALAGCSSLPGTADDGANDGGETSVVFGTGPDGGIFSVVGAGLSELINSSVDGARSSTQATAASLENTRLVRDGEVQLSLSDSVVVSEALAQSGPFAEDPALENVSFIGGGYPAYAMHLVRADSDIESLADMKGRSVCIAPGIQSTMLDQVLSAFDLSLDDLEVTIDEYANCADKVSQGAIDMFNINVGSGAAVVMQAAAGGDMRILSVPEGTEEKITEAGYPVWFQTDLPADAYDGLAGLPASVVANSTGMVIGSTELSEQFVYDFVKAMDENAEELQKLHPQLSYYAFPDAAENPFEEDVIPTHPGALRYYEENGWR